MPASTSFLLLPAFPGVSSSAAFTSSARNVRISTGTLLVDDDDDGALFRSEVIVSADESGNEVSFSLQTILFWGTVEQVSVPANNIGV